MKFARPVLLGLGLTLAQGLAVAGNPPQQAAVEFDLPPQLLSTALNAFAQQSDLRVVFYTDVAEGMKSPEVRGTLTPESALKILLAPTELAYEFSNNTVTIWSAKESAARGNQIRLADGAARATESAPGSQSVGSRDSAEPSTAPPSAAPRRLTPDTSDTGIAFTPATRGIPEILVKGKRSLNADIQRTENDSQPYVVFDKEALQQSSATSVEDFIRKNLPMASAVAQGTKLQGRSEIGLRGLESDETLILINGRRSARPRTASNSTQTDLNGIPLAAIERIEVLPTTASGIYGGSATGGVINVILRRNYDGLATTTTYGGTFDGGGSVRRVDIAGGASFGNGRTTLTATATIEDQDGIQVDQRPFVLEGRTKLAGNNVAALNPSGSFPLYGLTANFRNSAGTSLYGPGTSSFGSVPIGYGGGAGVGGLAPAAGLYNIALSPSSSALGGGKYSIDAPVQRSAGSVSLTHDATDRLTLFADAQYSRNKIDLRTNIPVLLTVPAGVPGNPFATSVQVTYPTASTDRETPTVNTSLNAVLGTTFKLTDSWSLNLEGGYASAKIQSNPAPSGFTSALAAAVNSGAANLFADRAIDLAPYLLASPYQSPFNQDALNVSLRAAGPLFEWYAGQVETTTLLEHRRENFDQAQFDTLIFPGLSQEVESAYVEASIPLLQSRGPADNSKWTLQLAGRHDRYSTDSASPASVGTTITRFRSDQHSTNPTVSTLFTPVRDISFRASYGSGFLPPSATQLVPLPSATITRTSDPRRGGEAVTLLPGEVLFGGNQGAAPEDSSSWSAGFILTPRFLENFRFSADYTRIQKTDNIVPVGLAVLIANEQYFPGRITRAPTTPGDQFGVGRIIAIDQSNVNIAKSDIGVVDFNVSYSRRFSAGTLGLHSMATWQTKYTTQFLPTSPVVDQVGLSGFINPLRFRGVANVDWRSTSYRLGWSTRFRHSYELDRSAATRGPAFDYVLSNGGDAIVKGTTYHDFFGAMNLPMLFAGSTSEIQLAVSNVFNQTPRFDPSAGTVFLTSPYDDQRLRSYRVAVQLNF